MNTYKVPLQQTANRLERQWTNKLQEQAIRWKSAKPDQRYTTSRGVPVVRLYKRAAAKRKCPER